jgi:hypothetical protein
MRALVSHEKPLLGVESVGVLSSCALMCICRWYEGFGGSDESLNERAPARHPLVNRRGVERDESKAGENADGEAAAGRGGPMVGHFPELAGRAGASSENRRPTNSSG